MKRLIGAPFDEWRDRSEDVLKLYGSPGDTTCGVFRLNFVTVAGQPTSGGLMVIASQGTGWDHVSVSHRKRCPTWEEMVFVKRAFFNPDEWVVEFHPPEKANISVHPYCLHLWRPNDGRELPIPPPWTIG